MDVSTQAAFSAEGIRCQFGGLLALRDVKFSVVPGEVRAIIGPNGAGKSTLVNVCTGIYRPTAGRLFVGGIDVTGKRAHQVSRAGVARTFQNIRLLANETVFDNVLLASETHQKVGKSSWDRFRRRGQVENVSRERATACLDLVGLNERGKDRAGELPYGSQRMVEIARALATDPTVLFLDEPTSGLSGPEIERTARLVDELKEAGVAVVIVEHNMPFVMERADRITVLNFGVLLAEGSPTEISRNQDVITAYLGEPGPANDEWGALA